MDVPPTATLGWPRPPISLPLPPSYISFFPMTSTTAGPATIARNFFHPKPVFRESKPHWHRVPKTASKLDGRRRKIVMKLIARLLAQPYQRRITSRPVDKHYIDKENEISQSKRVRVNVEAPQGFNDFITQSSAEQDSYLYWQSKAEVVNHIALHPDSVFDHNGRDFDLGGLAPVIRQKRRVDSTPAQGANLAFYRDLLALVVAAWEMDGLNTTKTDLVEHMVSLEGTRRDPRNFLAAVGASDLSAITDATEPDSTHVLMKPPPTTPAWTSAARRKARLSSYMLVRSEGNQPSAGPAISNTTSGESPTKSRELSTPSQKKETTRVSLNITPEHPSDHAPNGPTRVFKAPSYSGSTTDDEETEEATAEVETSPVKRPGAPTPSRWSRAEPSTPTQRATPQPVTPGTTDPLGLLAAVPASMTSSQPTPPSWKKWEKAASPQAVTFQFSDASFEETQASDQYSVFGSKADRRRSEPLLQHLLKDRARRFSTSPQKFFAGTDRFDEPIAAGPSTPVRPQHNSMGNNESPKVGNESDFYTPLPSYLRPNFNLPQKTNDSPAKRNGFYRIDMRQNPDIFGTQAPRDDFYDEVARLKDLVKLAEEKSAKVEDILKLAEEKCGGDAKVVITHENDKLVVRFKLPTKYASLFPQSQGFDESRFTVTPSAVSSSPRIRFNDHQFQAPAATGDKGLVGQDTTGDLMSLDEASMAVQEKPVPADGAASEDTEASSLSELDHTPTLGTLREVTVGAAVSTSPHLAQSEDLVSSSGYESATKSVSFAMPSSTRSNRSRLSSPTKRPLVEANKTLIVGDFNTDSTHELPSTETPTAADLDPDMADMSSLVETPTRQLQQEALEAPSSSLISDVTFEPTFQTPTYGHIDFSPSRVSNATPTRANEASGSTPELKPTKASPAKKAVGLTKTSTPSKRTPSSRANEASGSTPEPKPTKASPAKKAAGSTKTPTPSKRTPSKRTPKTTAEAAAESTPTLATSFTPVNKPVAHSKPATPNASGSSSSIESEPVQDDGQAVAPEATNTKSDVQDYDSPGRAYISAFIRRSKPKRATATETGSPVPNSVARQPLGDKSPNTASPSPQKGKRKLEAEDQENDSPLKAKEERASKRPRHGVKSVKKNESETKSKTEASTSKSAARGADSAHGADSKATEVADEAPRRSTRIRKQPAEAQPPKSSIPTAIRLNRAGTGRGNGGQVLNSSARNDQAELMRQTSLNTKRNRGNSESVQRVLARYSEELSSEDADETMKEPKPSKRGNNVGWRTPLESWQQTPKSKKQGKKATQGNTGITKAKAAPKSRISQAAKNLGMASNGTPAKRMTRAQTRRQA